MIKEREPALERISVLLQIGITILCFFFVVFVSGNHTNGIITNNQGHVKIALIIIPIWFGLLELFDLGAMARIQRYRQIIKKYFFVVVAGTISLSFFAQVLNYEWLSTTMLLTFATINFLVLNVQKLAGRTALKYLRRKGYNT